MDEPQTGNRFKRAVVFCVALFLAFAPPGTLIFGAAFLIWLIGNVWLTVAAVLSLALITILILRCKIRKS